MFFCFILCNPCVMEEVGGVTSMWTNGEKLSGGQ